MRFAIITFGCKINQYESQRIREALTSQGHVEQAFGEAGADCYIINTCTVTHRSDADARRSIRRALGFGVRVIATGCQAVVYPDALRAISSRMEVVLPEDMSEALGVECPGNISGFDGHSRAFVKVQQGCDNFCTYCIVPFARGRPYSRPWADIVKEINVIHTAGYNEVILTGINIGLYSGGLCLLIDKILERTSIPRIRISSIEPWTLDHDLFELLSSQERLCRHLHLPLQSGNDSVLKAMGRPYDTRYFRSIIEDIRSFSSDIAIGTDVMAGFPGEDKEAFEQGYAFINNLDLTYMHVFPYSPRPGTKACGFSGVVDEKAKKYRAKMLRELSSSKKEAFIQRQVEKVQSLLVTKVYEGSFSGVTSNYLKIDVPGSASVGDIIPVVIDEVQGHSIRGRMYGQYTDNSGPA